MRAEDVEEQPIDWLRKSTIKPAGFQPLEAGKTVKDAIDALDKTDLNVLPIIDKANNDEVVGVVHRSDFLSSLKKTTLCPGDDLTKVANSSFVRVRADDPISKLVAVITGNDIDQVVVLNKDNKFYGIIDRNRLADEIEELGS